MIVHFIGAGPGDPELLTLKALKIIRKTSVCLYAGSLVPKDIIKLAPANARIKNTASMTLEQTHAEIKNAYKKNLNVARIHSGDPSLYGAITEQIDLLKNDNIPYAIIPGVPAFAAAAAAIQQELTIPQIAQSIILTRLSMQSTPMPENETLENFAKTKTTLAIHLAIRSLHTIERTLTPFYGSQCPVVVVYRASWPDQIIIRATLETIRKKIRKAKITRTALILVGPALVRPRNPMRSALYDPQKPHILRLVKGVKLIEDHNI